MSEINPYLAARVTAGWLEMIKVRLFGFITEIVVDEKYCYTLWNYKGKSYLKSYKQPNRRMKVTEQEKWIIEYLTGRDWTSPSDIGWAHGDHLLEQGKCVGTGHHSSWASPKCLKLVKAGLLERNKRGRYRLVTGE